MKDGAVMDTGWMKDELEDINVVQRKAMAALVQLYIDSSSV